MPSEGLPSIGKTKQKQVFCVGGSMVLIMLQKCIRKRVATDLGGPNLAFGASFGCPEPPMDSNLEAQNLPRTPTWTPKPLPDLQAGVQRPFQNPNMEAQSGPRRQLVAPRAHFGGPKRSKTPTWRSEFQWLPKSFPRRPRY